MPDPFLSSDEYDDRAHQLYNEGQYDEAIDLLRQGLRLYPDSVELEVGMGYARLAREEFAWARRAFEAALVGDPEHEEALAGLGEVLLKVGARQAALGCFDRVLALGFEEDLDLVLQMGRALFREGMLEPARRYFELAVHAHGESAEAAACVGYAAHRLAQEADALPWRSSRSTPRPASTWPTCSTTAATTSRPSASSRPPTPRTTGTSWGSGASSS